MHVDANKGHRNSAEFHNFDNFCQCLAKLLDATSIELFDVGAYLPLQMLHWIVSMKTKITKLMRKFNLKTIESRVLFQ